MRFPNALRGIHILQAATILNLCTAVLAAIFAVLGLVWPYSHGSLWTLVFHISSLPLFFGLSLALLVVLLVGLSQAARDHSKFAEARAMVVIGLIMSLVGDLVLESDTLPYALLSLLVSLCGLRATVLILRGILAFAELFRYENMLLTGKRLIPAAVLTEGFAMAAELLNDLSAPHLDPSLPLTVITVISLALRIRVLRLYLEYLKDAEEMLTIGNPALGRPGSVSRASSHTSDRSPQ